MRLLAWSPTSRDSVPRRSEVNLIPFPHIVQTDSGALQTFYKIKVLKRPTFPAQNSPPSTVQVEKKELISTSIFHRVLMACIQEASEFTSSKTELGNNPSGLSLCNLPAVRISPEWVTVTEQGKYIQW
jgi:hypothetical protein